MTEKKKISLKGLGETRKFAGKYVKGLKKGGKAMVVGLHGDLGVGKTYFVQGVAEALGVKENVASPTFVLMKKYPVCDSCFKNLVHIDAYRLDKPEQISALNWDEVLNDPENLVFVEWPEKISGFLPEDAKKLCFTFVDPETREAEIIC